LVGDLDLVPQPLRTALPDREDTPRTVEIGSVEPDLRPGPGLVIEQPALVVVVAGDGVVLANSPACRHPQPDGERCPAARDLTGQHVGDRLDLGVFVVTVERAGWVGRDGYGWPSCSPGRRHAGKSRCLRAWLASRMKLESLL
jgi:hypothetical protein